MFLFPVFLIMWWKFKAFILACLYKFYVEALLSPNSGATADWVSHPFTLGYFGQLFYQMELSVELFYLAIDL